MIRPSLFLYIISIVLSLVLAPVVLSQNPAGKKVVDDPVGSTYYFPQVADGNLTGYFYYTEFWFNNVQSTPTTVQLAVYTETGAPWVLDMRSSDLQDPAEVVGSSWTFVMQPYTTVNIYTAAGDSLAVGWAVVQTSQPVVASASFGLVKNTTDPLTLLWTAGVLPSPVSTKFAFEANVSLVHDLITAVDIGFAAVNINSQTATVTASLIPRWGGDTLSTKTFTLEAGAHTSHFLSELFNTVTWGSYFHGTVRFSSDLGIAMVALKHSYNSNSDVYSTLSVLSESELKRNVKYDQEDNGSFELAHPITAPVEVVGTMNKQGDGPETDYFAIDLTSGQVLYVFLLGDMVGSPLHGGLALFDPGHALLVNLPPYPLTGLYDLYFRYDVTATGTYYLQIASFDVTSGRDSFYRMFVEVH